MDWAGEQGRHLRRGPLSRDLATEREPVTQVSAGECFRQSWEEPGASSQEKGGM